jgi:hypothetical protein
MLRVFLHGFPKVALAQRNDLGQTLGLDGANESLRVGVQVGASRRELHCLDAARIEKLPERLCEQWIAIVDEVASSVQESIIGIGEISRNLLHPFSIWLRDNPGNLDPANLVAQIAEGAGDSGISPAGVVTGHPDDQLLDFDRCLGATGRAADSPIWRRSTSESEATECSWAQAYVSQGGRGAESDDHASVQDPGIARVSARLSFGTVHSRLNDPTFAVASRLSWCPSR